MTTMKKNLMGLAMATERNTDNEKEVTRAPARDSKGVNGSANGCVATADEGMEVLPKNVGFVEDEGMEVDTTDRLQTTFTESEEIELLRCKSLDSVLFHKAWKSLLQIVSKPRSQSRRKSNYYAASHLTQYYFTNKKLNRTNTMTTMKKNLMGLAMKPATAAAAFLPHTIPPLCPPRSILLPSIHSFE
jgi:hypothetical protein